jgi:hypothetical protein
MPIHILLASVEGDVQAAQHPSPGIVFARLGDIKVTYSVQANAWIGGIEELRLVEPHNLATSAG